MAIMIPDDIQVFTTPGEGAFYRLLQAAAWPDDCHLSWYLPDVQGRDVFILYSEDIGLIIFEVKDWAIDQIIEGTTQHFVLLMDGCEEKRQNSLQQARTYFNLIMEKIRQDTLEKLPGSPLKYRAATVIVGHNHPGGLPESSESDDVVTGEINNALMTVGISLQDHVIMAPEGFYSYRQTGQLGGDFG